MRHINYFAVVKVCYSPCNAKHLIIRSCRKTEIIKRLFEHVKYGTELLESIAADNGVSLVLYGHTHIQNYEYLDGLHLFNPGAVMEGCYGLVDIVNGQIMCIKANIYDR